MLLLRAARPLRVVGWRRSLSATSDKAWERPMDDATFQFMRDVIEAPSPIGLEASMTEGVLSPRFATFAPPQWKAHRFVGNAGLVWDTHPPLDDAGRALSKAKTPPLTVMIVGHSDKIRMQVRSHVVQAGI